jgi:drug/metabolite transporter (DMT)-like permease
LAKLGRVRRKKPEKSNKKDAMTTEILLSMLILATLAATSVAFDRYVSRRPVTRRADGETALWVAIGCAYTSLGAACLLALWAPWIGGTWHLGAWSLLALFVAYAAAGAPMLWGDLRRTQAWRETNAHLERAERANGALQ